MADYLLVKRDDKGWKWGVLDEETGYWFAEPTMTYPEAVRVMQKESLRREQEPQQPDQTQTEEPGHATLLQPNAPERVSVECIAALQAYIEQKKAEGHHCYLDRGPGRDHFGLFAVIRLDGKLTIWNWDKDSGRWY